MIRALAAIALAAAFMPPDVLIIERAYDGPRESVGHVVRWHYTGGYMLLEWADTGTDGIFRNSFEASP